MKFTATHLTVLAIVVLIGFFSFAAYDAHLKKQPEVVYIPTNVVKEIIDEKFASDSAVTVDQVEGIVENMFLGDSVVEKPIVYEYKESIFKESGTTYWFFRAEATVTKGKESSRQTNTRVIKMPYKFFNFEYAAGYLKENMEGKKENSGAKITQIFIEEFTQISEASYLSYPNYAKKY